MDPKAIPISVTTAPSPNPPSLATAQASPISLSPLPPPYQVTFSQPIVIKLDDKNYFLWRRQVLATVKGHNLLHYIDRTAKVPQQFALLEDALVDRVSEEFLLWKQQDQLLLPWLMASMSESILTHVVECDITWQVWEKIQAYFASHTKAQVQRLKTELRNTSKGSTPISEYLLCIKALVNALASIGCYESELEHIEVILGGLSTEYDAIVTSITMRIEPYLMAEVEAPLLVQEAHIEQATQKLNASTLQAYVANRNTNGASGDPFGAVNPQAPLSFTGYCGGRGGQSSGCGFQGHRGYSFGLSSLTCQLCHKFRHTSFNCWHRCDQNFTPSPPPPPPYAHFTSTYPPHYMPSPPPSPAYPSSYAIAPARVPSPIPSLFSHFASVAMPDFVVDVAWYPYSEASSPTMDLTSST